MIDTKGLREQISLVDDCLDKSDKLINEYRKGVNYSINDVRVSYLERLISIQQCWQMTLFFTAKKLEEESLQDIFHKDGTLDEIITHSNLFLQYQKLSYVQSLFVTMESFVRLMNSALDDKCTSYSVRSILNHLLTKSLLSSEIVSEFTSYSKFFRLQRNSFHTNGIFTPAHDQDKEPFIYKDTQYQFTEGQPLKALSIENICDLTLDTFSLIKALSSSDLFRSIKSIIDQQTTDEFGLFE